MGLIPPDRLLWCSAGSAAGGLWVLSAGGVRLMSCELLILRCLLRTPQSVCTTSKEPL